MRAVEFRRAAVKITRVAVAIAVLAVIGCGEEPTGRRSADLDRENEALKAKVAQRKEQQKNAPPKARQAPAPAPVPAQAPLGIVEKGYVYDATGKRDPFRNFKWDRPDRLEENVALGPLEQFDLAQLSLVAVVWQTGNAKALIRDPSGESHVVSEGSRIGKNEGYVVSIDDNMVRVKETYVDFLGQRTTKDIELSMRRNEGG
jgi:Tfp pilus assembly protein PilP